MKNMIFGFMTLLALVAFSNTAMASDKDCNGSNCADHNKTMKCGDGKCGGDKKSTKCGDDKKEKTMKCGAGKCGGGK